ncbi:hypothetical protein MTR_4g039360 [Medicago truncatula]|uniref:Uncharacterized protein n=1 Tax=Medicago truncatula TaxID=3880 RepID=G7JTJ0_MEDTR|nr:hypothetical protein MTR_4g039360 [Medicago truncatula]
MVDQLIARAKWEERAEFSGITATITTTIIALSDQMAKKLNERCGSIKIPRGNNQIIENSSFSKVEKTDETKKINNKLATYFQVVLKEFQKTQRLAAERETT